MYGPLEVIGVDIPIVLPYAGRRRADELVRKVTGPRLASVFITPVRATLEASDHDTASAENRRLAGEGSSRQAFALRGRLRCLPDCGRGAARAPGFAGDRW